jgi:hypothetical protein
VQAAEAQQLRMLGHPRSVAPAAISDDAFAEGRFMPSARFPAKLNKTQS